MVAAYYISVYIYMVSLVAQVAAADTRLSLSNCRRTLNELRNSHRSLSAAASAKYINEKSSRVAFPQSLGLPSSSGCQNN